MDAIRFEFVIFCNLGAENKRGGEALRRPSLNLLLPRLLRHEKQNPESGRRTAQDPFSSLLPGVPPRFRTEYFIILFNINMLCENTVTTSTHHDCVFL